jgi:MYXO-CTERM domain-containing protein
MDHRIPSVLVLALGLGLGLWAGPAQAHIELFTPGARYTPNLQKDDPCGDPLNPPGEDAPTVYQAGETITIEFEEFVDHSSYFRVAVDLTGTDNFTSPAGFDDFYNSPEVIADEIPDLQDGGLHLVEVMLPDTLCDPCTLQLIQVMTDDGAWGPGNDDLYFQCADIVIGPASADDGGPMTTGGDGDTGNTAEGGNSSGGNPFEPDGDGGNDDSGTEGSAQTAGSDDAGGCSCRTDRGPTGAMPWLLIALVAWRRPGVVPR